MKHESKIINFIIKVGDSIENAYKHSLLSKLLYKIVNLWNNSIFGGIINSFFDIEVYKNSMFYKILSSSFQGILRFTITTFPLKEAVRNSKYINSVKKINSRIKLIGTCRVKSVIRNSIFLNTVYEFWIGLE